MPAIVVLPAPGTSASTKRIGGMGSMWPNTASIWSVSGVTGWTQGPGAVEQTSETDAARLWGQMEETTFALEAPASSGWGRNREVGFVVAKQHPHSHGAFVPSVS